MNICFDRVAWEHYVYWSQVDKRIFKRINLLIESTLRHPYDGIGKPEPLKENLSGYWSRRIDEEHRFVYRIRDNNLLIAQCRFHYK